VSFGGANECVQLNAMATTDNQAASTCAQAVWQSHLDSEHWAKRML